MLLLDLLYLTALGVASPYCAYKLLTQRKIRAGLKEKLGFVPPRHDQRPCVWFHCVSVGEVGLARELVRRFEQRFPGVEPVISTGTDTGRSAAGKSFPNHTIFYYPFDFSPCVGRTLRAIRPQAIVLMELELWPNLIFTARRKGVPVIIVNGRITENNFRRLSRVRFLVEPLLNSLHTIAVQDADYARRITALGADPAKVVITGNMKYDTVKSEIPPDYPAYAAIRSLQAHPLLVGGCTWAGEEEALLRIYADLKRSCPGLGLVLAPKHAERLAEVRRLIERAGFAHAELSSLKLHTISDENNRIPPDCVILVDTFGELDAVYAAADIVFVGRSLTQHGGQNMLEPAALGKPVIFGPYTENFKEAAELLLAARAAIRVNSEAELHRQVAEFIDNPDPFLQAGAEGRKVIEAKKGTTERNIGLLEHIIA